MSKTITGLLIITFVLLLGCLGPQITAPPVEGKTCDGNINCIVEAFYNDCEKAYGTINFADQNITGFIQVVSKENDQCKGYLKLVDGSVPDIVKGLDAECLISKEEAEALETELNLEELNCKGPLFEALKLQQSFTQNQ